LGQMVHDAQESETGCCICTCKDSFICESLHGTHTLFFPGVRVCSLPLPLQLRTWLVGLICVLFVVVVQRGTIAATTARIDHQPCSRASTASASRPRTLLTPSLLNSQRDRTLCVVAHRDDRGLMAHTATADARSGASASCP
jgi:hypothetical protein